jgi:hypothetical protein
MVTMLRLNLFTYELLQAWLDEPTETQPILLDTEQLNSPYRKP